MRLLLLLALLLAVVSAQIDAPSFCHLQIGTCLSLLAKENLGYEPSVESIWSFMSRRAPNSQCRELVKPYLTNPPYLAVPRGTGDELIACLDAM